MTFGDLKPEPHSAVMRRVRREMERIRMRFKHKFNAKPTTRNGIRFDSKKEANYYDQLCLLQLAGEVLFFLRQIPFDLPGNTKYRVDFQVFYKNGDIRFIDVKGMRTKDFIRNKKQVEAIYPVDIEEV